jgi:alpha-glucosidase
MTDLNHWWQQAIIYQCYLRSFNDSNGDGVGDLPGLIEKLDYLRRLGVDTLWISPFYPSPMADLGFDITDHTDVDPLFGTLADFHQLVATAHQLDLKILIDFVPNHTSEEHPWFVESRATRDNPRRDWYLRHDPAPDGGPPTNWRTVFGGRPAWTFDPQTRQYYYHKFLTPTCRTSRI